jgi:hypothetical protein
MRIAWMTSMWFNKRPPSFSEDDLIQKYIQRLNKYSKRGYTLRGDQPPREWSMDEPPWMWSRERINETKYEIMTCDHGHQYRIANNRLADFDGNVSGEY